MTNIIVFVQVQGTSGITEAELAAQATHDELEAALSAAGVPIPDGALLFIDEEESSLHRQAGEPVEGLKHGCRLHYTRCRSIEVTAHFLEKTARKAFAPGARVRKVKAWAVVEFKLDGHDAAEHVLQICNSTIRPPTDTPIHELTDHHKCSVCFDLVPEKRVEG